MKRRALRAAELIDVVTSACNKRLFIIWLFGARAVIIQLRVFESRYQLSVELIATRSLLSSSTAPSPSLLDISHSPIVRQGGTRPIVLFSDLTTFDINTAFRMQS